MKVLLPMLIIKIPGTCNTFIINECSSSLLIEQELEKVFFPYAEKLIDLSIDQSIDCDIYIETNGIDYARIAIQTTGNIIEKYYRSYFDVYRGIYTIIRDHIKPKNGYCFLHGSCVCINNAICFFLAKTGVGKSTLSVYYDSQKHICVTDDIIIFDYYKEKIVPISKCAHIRALGSSLLSNDTVKDLKYNSFISRYEYLLSPKRFSLKYNKVAFFLLHRDGSIPRITKSGGGYSSILENMLLPYPITSNLRSAIHICKHYNVYEVFYDNLDILLKQINELLDNYN